MLATDADATSHGTCNKTMVLKIGGNSEKIIADRERLTSVMSKSSIFDLLIVELPNIITIG